MNQEFDRIFLGGIEAGRADEEALDLVPSAAVNQKDSILGKIELGEEGVVEVGDLRGADCSFAIALTVVQRCVQLIVPRHRSSMSPD